MDFLSFQASFRPDKLALVDLTFARRWTFHELSQLVDKLASYLRQRGIKAGDRVACISKNRAEIVALYFACARCQSLFVPLNWRLSQPELQMLLEDSDPSLVFGDDKAAEIGIEHESIDILLSAAASVPAPSDLSCDIHAPSLILYSSGTTGQPKGAVHTSATLMESILNSTLLYQVDSSSVFLCEAPMFHIIGLVSSIQPVLYNGGHVLISDGFIPQRTLERLSSPELGITHYFCIPQMSNALRQVEGFDPQKLRRLTALMTGGAPHPEVQIRRWLHDDIAIVDGYGMSEAGTIFGMPINIKLIDKKAGCVGFHGPRLAVRLCDSKGKTVDIGQPGEVQLKGDGLFIGYWRKESVFKDSFTPDGWFETGDIAVQDQDGYYRIVDRKKDMFISGGENVYPAEVEALVLKHPAVKECAMIGIADEKWGEVGCLYVVAHSHVETVDLPTMLDYLDKQIAKYKLPKQLIVIDALPRTSSGKVLKHVLSASVFKSA